VIDDLADTGATVKLIRAVLPRRMSRQSMQSHSDVPRGHVYHRGIAGHWIYFPWDLGLSFQAPIAGPGRVTTTSNGQRSCACGDDLAGMAQPHLRKQYT